MILIQGLKKVKAHGIGVHKPEEIAEFGNNDLRVLSDILADKPFFFGDEPTNVAIVLLFCFLFVCFHTILIHFLVCVTVGCSRFCEPCSNSFCRQRNILLSERLYDCGVLESGGSRVAHEGALLPGLG